MPSKYSTDCAKLCRHPRSRTGCSACCAHDLRADIHEAESDRSQRQATIDGCIQDMKRPAAKKKELRAKQASATEQRLALEQRLVSLKAVLASVETTVKGICAKHEPDKLEAAFAQETAAGEQELWSVLQQGSAGDETKDARIRFKDAEHLTGQPFQGLDRSTIPATPDSLLSETLGFQMYMRIGKSLGRSPDIAVGQKEDVAIMAHGRANIMFGTLKPPLQEEAKSEPSEEHNLEDDMARIRIADANPASGQADSPLENPEVGAAPAPSDLPRPTTEAEYRQQNGDKWRLSTEDPLLSTDQQWELLGKFGSHIYLLARFYANLVRQKARAVQDFLDAEENEEEPGIEDPRNTAPLNGLPQVEGLDIAGFTNWLERCTLADPAFAKFIRKWKEERIRLREIIVPALESWKPPVAAPDPSRRTYYSGPPLNDIDVLELRK
ncbi:hypothetical protein LTR27_002572 [Elasticomyces elasticus]|nr:hypothetical protein LTR27_002572 [Elasticomyces elasticus]